ncbi:polysaccharide deacetylase family protein [Neolewinella antarctica]|uniref:DUF7033 domain-containing protein n=1 Tax=Neolewinella antarctica TaxID=442734 RepID=A0ABX0X5U4_9BACT|nr:polysaccharide deacetylase family protein [Neolewinella antarctica]NJC24579.1 hypothetical protein [Neolewinella antarctica]
MPRDARWRTLDHPFPIDVLTIFRKYQPRLNQSPFVPPATILFLAPHRHPRLRYVLKELGRDLGYKFRLFTDQLKWESADGDYRITYGVEVPSSGAVELPAHDFLAGSHPSGEDLRVVSPNGHPVFFHAGSGRGTVRHQCDLLACVFFCLSRYEEYGATTYDRHGRFSGANSHASRNGYLTQPVVRMWTGLIGALLKEAYPNLPPARHHNLYFQPTYDIDLLWAYHHRGLRGLASGVRDLLNGHGTRVRARFTTKPDEDPYQNLAYLIGLTSSENSATWMALPQIFWLLADNADHRDSNAFPIPRRQKEIMVELKGLAYHGIHPGYQSWLGHERIRTELDRLRDILGAAPTHSRQHFLRLRLPETYDALLLAGIDNDHTMGYADAVGWRSGTNLPHKWYDLRRETATRLLVHPFAAMDVTLKNYLKLSPWQAITAVLGLARSCQPYGGPFPLLWHNSSFATEFGWAGWAEAYESIILELRNLMSEFDGQAR